MFKHAVNEDVRKRNTYTTTLGIIKSTEYTEGGNARYYVSFQIDGETFGAQTDTYSSITKSLTPGDVVTIGYYMTQKGNYRAIIHDKSITPISVDLQQNKFILLPLLAGLLFFAVASIYLIQFIESF